MTEALTCDEVDRQLKNVARDVLSLLLAAEPTKARPLSEVFWETHNDGRLGAVPSYNDVFALVKAQPVMQEEARVRAGGDPKGRGLDNVAGAFLSTYLQNAITEDYVLDEARIKTLIEDACAFLIDGVHRIHTLHFLTGILLSNSVSLGTITVRPIGSTERDKLLSILSGDFEERKSLFKTVKDGYTARSKLSQGRELTPALRGIDQRFSELVRRALAQYLTYVHRNRVTNGTGESDFIRRLDERSLGGPPVV